MNDSLTYMEREHLSRTYYGYMGRILSIELYPFPIYFATRNLEMRGIKLLSESKTMK